MPLIDIGLDLDIFGSSKRKKKSKPKSKRKHVYSFKSIDEDGIGTVSYHRSEAAAKAARMREKVSGSKVSSIFIE